MLIVFYNTDIDLYYKNTFFREITYTKKLKYAMNLKNLKVLLWKYTIK